MARRRATPESRKHRYGTPGRTLADWEALNFLWYDSAEVQAAFPLAYSKCEFHAFAEPRTQATAEGRRLTKLIWSEMRKRGITVSRKPVHFALGR